MQLVSDYNTQQLKEKYEEYAAKYKDASEKAQMYLKEKNHSMYAKYVIESQNLKTLAAIFWSAYKNAVEKEKSDNAKKTE